MYLDPTIVSWLLIGGASLCAFMIGRNVGQGNKDEVIENTIIYLVENGFVKSKKVDGELELMKLDEVDTE